MTGLGVRRWIVGRLLRLPPRLSGRLTIDRDVAVPMRDGVMLFADHFYGAAHGPTVLMRSPYGRGSMFAGMASMLAERGFQVLLQSVRGTGGSQGDFDAMRQEKDDGADTVAWVRGQTWFDDRLYAMGGSYLGNAVWAMASAAPEAIDGAALSITLSNFRDELLGGGGLTQGGTMAWSQAMQMLAFGAMPTRRERKKLPKLDGIHGHLPLGTLDQAAFGKTLPWWQDWVSHPDPQDEWWQALDYGHAVTALGTPVSMAAGWQDIFLSYQLQDFAARQAAGLDSWLTIGPWSHTSPSGGIAALRDAAELMMALREKRPPWPGRGRVRLFVQGAKQWRDYDSWPPPEAQPLTLYLRSRARLDDAPAQGDDGSVAYTYDPADPTPSLHGPQVMGGSKKRDMSALEARADTVSFTAAPLTQACEVIGPVSVTLAIRSDRAHCDFFACLCEVDGQGRPIQVTDGYMRLRPARPDAGADGIRHITIACGPTAHRFARGNRLRLIIASGAHPRFARNLGTGEPMSTATQMVAAQQEIVLAGSHLTLSMMP